MKHALCIVLAAVLAWPAVAEVYQKPEDFIASAFGGTAPEPQILWMTKNLRPTVARIIGRDPGTLRVRYWAQGARTAWILEAIGKYQPITTGIVVDDGKIARLRVLVYRESHGWEVRYPFFTDQFKSVRLDDDTELDRDVDGISGATLSVNALKRLARLALFFHGSVANVDE